MSIQSIAIPSTLTLTPPSGSKPYTAYHITLTTAVRAWSVDRRYSDFESLARELEHEVGQPLEGMRLPGKKLWSLTRAVNDRALIEERRVALEAFLRHLLAHKDARWRSSHAFLDFVGAPSSATRLAGAESALAQAQSPPFPSTSSSSTSWTGSHQPSSPLPPAPDTFESSAAWLAEYSVLLGLTRSIRSSLARRDAALAAASSSSSSSTSSVGGAHTAGVMARKDCLTLLGRLGTLARGLAEVGRRESLGGGELGRRVEMVTGLQDDCGRLTKLANQPAAAAASRRRSITSAGWEDNDARASLLGGARGGGTAFRSPAAAAAAAETEQTRALDSGGLLHLQQTQIESQDEMLRGLSTILQRQKTLGEAIAHEIHDQNELLDGLETQVDRTGAKLGRTKRQMNRLN